MFCKNCGTEIKANAKFCVKCGTPVKTAAPQVQMPKAPKEPKQISQPKEPKQASQPKQTSQPKEPKQASQPKQAVQPKQKKNGPRIVVVVIICVLILVLGGAGAFAVYHNLQERAEAQAQEQEEKERREKEKEEEAKEQEKTEEQKADTEEKESDREAEDRTEESGQEAEEKKETADQEAEDKKEATNQEAEDKKEAADQENVAHRYQIVMADVTWSEAYLAAAEVEGGYLVHIDSKEEMDTIVNMIREQGQEKGIFWLGGMRTGNNTDYHWIDKDGNQMGDALNQGEYWLEGEPSLLDTEMNVEEKYMNMFYMESAQGFVWNDTVNDLVTLAPNYAGRVGYIIEIEE